MQYQKYLIGWLAGTLDQMPAIGSEHTAAMVIGVADGVRHRKDCLGLIRTVADVEAMVKEIMGGSTKEAE